jgi:fido (protein-threonine AMPylation protein)
MMFLVAEVHPYADGNGRMARLMMHAELTHGERCPVILPAVYQEKYRLALRALTHQGDADPYIQMLDRAQEYTAQIDFNDFDMACAQFRESGAFLRASEGRWLKPCEVFWD